MFNQILNRDKRSGGIINDNLYDNNKQSIYSTDETYDNENDNINYKIDYDFSDNKNENDTDSFKNTKLLCELCNLEGRNEKSNYIILSCCHSIFHVKCLVNKLNLYKISDEMKNFTLNDAESITSKSSKKSNNVLVFNENSITHDYLNNIICTHCRKNLHHEDIFSLHSKNALYNRKHIGDYYTQINSLKDQQMKIENEIKCLTEYITKLDNEKKISKIIMSKTYSLMTE